MSTPPTDTVAADPAPAPFAPVEAPRPRPRSNHPVARFVGLCAVVLLALAGIRWTGAVNPWVDLETRTYGETAAGRDGDDVLGYAAVVVHNRGALPLDVTAVELVRPQLRRARVYLRRPRADLDALGPTLAIAADGSVGADLAPFDHLRLGAGERREIVVVYRDPCPGANAGLIRVEVESVLGRRRSVDNTTVEGTGPGGLTMDPETDLLASGTEGC